MDRRERDRWLKGFVDDLVIGGERVPLERVVAARIDGFTALRGEGLTWRAIAALITRSGGRRKDGMPISGDQLRAVVARRSSRELAPLGRTIQAQSAAESLNALSAASDHTLRHGWPANASSRAILRRKKIEMPQSTTVDAKEVSEGEIAAALLKIGKGNKV